MNDPCSRVSREPLPEELFSAWQACATAQACGPAREERRMVSSIFFVPVATPLLYLVVVSIKRLGLAQSR